MKTIENHLGKEITYTPMTLNEFRYRLNFNDLFLNSIFQSTYKEVINQLEEPLRPDNLPATITKKTITPQA